MKTILLRDLPCYEKLPEEERKKIRISPDAEFRIPEVLADDVKEQLAGFLYARASVLACSSLRSERTLFHGLGKFLSEKYPEMDGIGEHPLPEMERAMKAWMLKRGNKLVNTKKGADEDRVRAYRHPLLCYLERFCEYCLTRDDSPSDKGKDIWKIDALPFPVRRDPSRRNTTIRFTGILQTPIRDEVKEAVAVEIRYLALGSIYGQIGAVKRLSLFLNDAYPEIDSLARLDREVLEDYLIYLKTQVKGKNSFRSELSALKSLLDTAGLCLNAPSLQNLFVKNDISDRARIRGYTAYTDEELKMWNDVIRLLPVQIARALVIHQLLGNRISETLTLTWDCVCLRDGKYKVRIQERKTQRTIYKPAGDTVRALIERAKEETARSYGPQEYIFVSSRDPSRPMSYGTIQYHLRKLIRQQQLKKPDGQLYGAWTHAFRHTLGKKLTEQHFDDKTIAQLLGHSSLSSVHRYREFGSRELAKETRQFRKEKDEILQRMMEEPDDEI